MRHSREATGAGRRYECTSHEECQMSTLKSAQTQVPRAQATLADRVVATMPLLSNAERRAARALLARYPTTGMESVALFAERSKVSGPTILRFVTKLGFAGYAEFRRALLEEVERQGEYPLTRPHATGPQSTFADLAQSLANAVRNTFDMVIEADVVRLTGMLADEKRQVFLHGGDFTEPAARHLDYHLRKMRTRVRLFSQALPRRADELAEIGRRDVVILFDTPLPGRHDPNRRDCQRARCRRRPADGSMDVGSGAGRRSGVSRPGGCGVAVGQPDRADRTRRGDRTLHRHAAVARRTGAVRDDRRTEIKA